MCFMETFRYSAYHPLKYGASKKEVEKAIVVIQKNVRGMQCRQYLNVLKEKVCGYLDCSISMLTL